jgi:hypothetical protein
MEQNTMEQFMEFMEAQIGGLGSDLAKMNAKMDAHYEKMRAINKRYLGMTEAKKEPAPEETEAVEEPQAVPIGATDEEVIRATGDRAGELRLVLRHHSQRKKRA